MPDPQGARTPEELQELLTSHLEEIDRVLSWVSRRAGLLGDEADEFRSWVHLKLVEDDYRILRQFEGRSGLATYLTVVVQNLARDYRIRRWGRWRPSAAAERLGLVATQLEILLDRDGLSFEEAAETLRSNHRVKLSVPQLAELAGRLPPRVRPRVGGEEGVQSARAHDRTDRGLEESEEQRTLERTRAALAESLARLDPEDQLVLRMHYQSGLKMSAIASALNLKQRKLYTRRDRCLRELKAGLESHGLEGAEILEALSGWGGDLDLAFGRPPPELPPMDSSNSSGSDAR